MVKKQIVVGSSIEERPVARLVQTAGQYRSSLHLYMEGKEVNLKSIMGVISIGVLNGHTVVIAADGSDEVEACDAIVNFLE